MKIWTSSHLLSQLSKLSIWLVLLIPIYGYATPPEITPGELLVCLTPEALSELEELESKSLIGILFDQLNVDSYRPILPNSKGVENHNFRLHRTFLLRFSLTANLSKLKTALEDSDLIEEVTYNYLRPTLANGIVPNDSKFPEQWGLPLMQLPQAWKIEKGSRDIIIAIVDSGIDYRHDDLASKVWVNPNEIPDNGLDDDENGYIDDVYGWDFTDAPNLQAEGDFTEGDNEPIDESGHGTHVAGIAGALPDNGIGIAGVAWNCSLMAVRAGLTLGGGARMQDDDSAASIIYAADNGANIINMSWGSKQQSFVIRDAIDYAYQQGVVLVGAAGNSGESDSIFPAGYSKVISVASFNQNGERFYKSNFGASVDINAPGNSILSTHINNGYRTLTGTSMAASHVSGVAALMLSKRPSLTSEEVRQILINTVEVIPKNDSIEPDHKLVGSGSVNSYRALLTSSVLHARILSPQTDSGGSNSFTIIGTATGYKFDSWQLLLGFSTVPSNFTPITDHITSQKVDEQLAVWNTSSLLEGDYTIRLVVMGRDGSQTQDQVVVSVDNTPTKISSITAIETLYGDKSVSIFTCATDDVSNSTLYYRKSGHNSPFTSIASSSLGKDHIFSISLEIGQYQYYFSAQNTVGLQTIDDNNGKYYSLDVRNGTISPHGFTETSLGIDPHYIADVSTDFDNDGFLEIIGTPLSNSNIGLSDSNHSLVVYERSPSGKYQLVHSLSNTIMIDASSQPLKSEIDLETFTPLAVDDVDNDGLQEILARDKSRAFLIESTIPNGYPKQIVWETPFISSGKIADLDGDGNKEIIGIDNNNDRILIFENRGNNQYERIAALPNETEGKNFYSRNFALDDFNADGHADMLFGDSEGELFIYSHITNDNYNLHWQTQTAIEDITLIDSGDLTGDGRPEFVIGGTVSLPDVPSVSPIWKFVVYTYTSRQYLPIWEQSIAPYRTGGNSIAIADVDNDRVSELVLLTYPNLYVLKWNGTRFEPEYHRKVANTPSLLAADINDNGFKELYFNSEEGLSLLESDFASDMNSISKLTPWNVNAKPITAKVVEVTWNATEELQIDRGYNVYRAVGEKGVEPAKNKYQVIADKITSQNYLDRTVETSKTYWYAVTANAKTGNETEHSKAVSATPRTIPKIINASFQVPNLIIVTFDRQMSPSIGNVQSYLLRTTDRLNGIKPMSAIRDKMGTRTILTLETKKLKKLMTTLDNRYEIVVSNVTDIDDNYIKSAVSSVELQHSMTETEFSDLTQLRVYPNPVRPNQSDKGVITFDNVPVGTHIQLFTPKGELLEKLNVTDSDRNKKVWWLTNGSIGDVASGTYIYILKFGTHTKVGKISVIK